MWVRAFAGRKLHFVVTGRALVVLQGCAAQDVDQKLRWLGGAASSPMGVGRCLVCSHRSDEDWESVSSLGASYRQIWVLWEISNAFCRKNQWRANHCDRAGHILDRTWARRNGHSDLHETVVAEVGSDPIITWGRRLIRA